MLVQGQSGPIAINQSIAPGTQVPLRQGNLGDAIVSELHGRYYETNYRKMLFNGGVVGVTTTVGLAVAYTGLILSNNPGNTVNLVLQKCAYAFTIVFPAVAVIGLMTGFNAGTAVTHTTPVTPRSQYFGTGPSGVGTLDQSATMPTAPTINTILGAGLTGAVTTTPYIPAGIFDLEGSIILPPGGYCAFYTSAVSPTGGASFSFIWEEVPI